MLQDHDPRHGLGSSSTKTVWNPGIWSVTRDHVDVQGSYYCWGHTDLDDHVATVAMMMLGIKLLPCLDPWSHYSRDLYWWSCPKFLQEAVRAMPVSPFTGPGIEAYAPHWTLKQESWFYPPWESCPLLTIRRTWLHGTRRAGSATCLGECWFKWTGMTSTVTTQTYILDLGLALPNIYTT